MSIRDRIAAKIRHGTLWHGRGWASGTGGLDYDEGAPWGALDQSGSG